MLWHVHAQRALIHSNSYPSNHRCWWGNMSGNLLVRRAGFMGSTWTHGCVDKLFRSEGWTPRPDIYAQKTWLIFFRMRPDLRAKFHSSGVRPHQRATLAAVSNSQIGIMLSSSRSKYKSYQLTYESAIIQPRNIERLFRGGERHVSGWGEEPSDAAPGDVFFPLLAVSDNL